MNAKAISFTPEVLKAKLRALEEYGTCQTRRPVRRDWLAWMGEPDDWESLSNGTFRAFDHIENETRHFPGPFGAVGQRLWARERARVIAVDATTPHVTLRYELDGAEVGNLFWPARLKHPKVGHCISNGVFREGARHFLEVVDVRAERVSDISEQEALLEGVEPVIHHDADGREVRRWRDYEDLSKNGTSAYMSPIGSFQSIYDSIYGVGAHARDWCWVYTLKRAA